ncbi:small RNA 2'-O-methyltransferase [Drosophila willistoni]|uniref:small RNA 2'-O-methyltransferase n=1 Tax=Drosophila willistoni TaxID=7260 RepID=UPI001F0800B8|nr:small RNA 2'-O-methyltransferase [Drosophila willistoni]
MFSYKMPCGVLHTDTQMTDTEVSFTPRLWEQRYCAVIQILEDPRWAPKIKSVIDFGCSEMKLFQLMRRIETIEKILEVDIDEDVLKKNVLFIKPLVADYVRRRKRPLHVDVLQGSVAESSQELQSIDAVVALELIEHVYDDVLSKIPTNIFGFMQPKLVIISTPNSDYNVIFTRFKPLLSNGFRHHDHKFEWTREQFKSWCLEIVDKYPNYMFSLLGLGDPPEGYTTVGHATQMVIFVRKDLLDMPLLTPLIDQSALAEIKSYKLLHSIDFPYFVDTRTKEEIIWAEVLFELNRWKINEDTYDVTLQAYKMPISYLLCRTELLGATRDILDELLKENKKCVENDFILIEESDDDRSIDENDWDNPIKCEPNADHLSDHNECESWD